MTASDRTISERLASYGVTHGAAGANGRLLSYGGRSLGFAHSDQAVALLDLLDSLPTPATPPDGEGR